MNATLFQTILTQGECSWLDYKVQPDKGFFDAKDDENYLNARSEWLIDMAALANADSDERVRYLILGIHDDIDKKIRFLKGIEQSCDDAIFQDFAKSKFDPPIEFEYSTFEYQEKFFGIFKIRPAKRDELHIAREYVGGKRGKRYLAAGQLWIRRGSQNQIAMRRELTEALSPLAVYSKQMIAGKYKVDEKKLQNQYERIRNVFRWHDISDAQAAQILRPFGVNLAIFLDPFSFLERVTHKMLTFLAEHFEVSFDYLICKDDHPSYHRDEYRVGESSLCHLILDYYQKGLLKRVHFIRPSGITYSEIPSHNYNDDPLNQICIAIELARGVDDFTYPTFENKGITSWDYTKSRLGFKAVLWFLDRLESAGRMNLLAYTGTTVRLEAMKKFIKHEMHISELLQHHDAIHNWNPDDYVTEAKNLAQQIDEMPYVLQRVQQSRIDKLLDSIVSKPR